MSKARKWADRLLHAAFYTVATVSLLAGVAVVGFGSGWGMFAAPDRLAGNAFAAFVSGFAVWQVAQMIAAEKTRVLRAKVDMWDKADSRADLDHVRTVTGEHSAIEQRMFNVEEAEA